MRNLPLIALLTACSGDSDPELSSRPHNPPPTDTLTEVEHDVDHDGVWAEEGDCDDEAYAVHPGADELCNGIDDDCDGLIDNEPLDGAPFYTDGDGDGFGDPATEVFACAGDLSLGGDCDDTEPTIAPGFPAIPCDGLDNDCDAATHESGRITLEGVEQPDLPTALGLAIDGDTIALCEGSYLVPELPLGAAITVTGLGDPAVTSIGSSGAGAVFRVLGSATLAALTVRGGTGHDIGGNETAGDGLYVADGVTLTLQSAVITGNTAGYGGGIWLGVGAVLDATDSAIAGNTGDPQGAFALTEGGGVYASDNARILLATSGIDDNSADLCGGASLQAGAEIVGPGAATLSRNEATSLGGGGGCTRGDVAITGLEIADNTAPNAGGGLDSSDNLVLTDSAVLRNAGLDGGGIFASGDLEITRTTLDGNVGDADGGAISLAFGTVSLTDCTVTSNLATFFAAKAGGVRLFDARAVSVNSDWGTGATENSHGDVGLVQDDASIDYVGIADFTCVDPGGCI